ncbi:MAG: methyltransferase domain-containing protein [Armatimonadota bacterium]
MTNSRPDRTQPEQSPLLKTNTGDYPLHEFHLALDGREWTILHTGVVLTHEDESQYLRETRTRLPYGVALWPAAIALAQELASRGSEAFAGKTALELGAGTGLPGIVAASLGAHVVQTDNQELALSICRRNSEKNNLSTVEHRLVDWTDWQDTTRYDWILGSDIMYGDTLHSDLQHIFATNLAPGGRVLLSDPFRSVSMHLLEALRDEDGWSITATKWKLGDDADPRAIGVFELSRE